MKSVSLARLFATPWTVAHQAPPSMEFSRQEYWMHACMLSHFSRVQLYATLWTAAHQVPLSMGFSRQESWNGLPFPSPGDLPDPGIEPRSPTLQEDTLQSEPQGKPIILENMLILKRRKNIIFE